MTWAVDVLKDADEEPTEKFKILLRTPTNALLGEVNRAAVNVLNVANGRRIFPFLIKRSLLVPHAEFPR